MNARLEQIGLPESPFAEHSEDRILRLQLGQGCGTIRAVSPDKARDSLKGCLPKPGKGEAAARPRGRAAKEGERNVEKSGNLILTGWGYPEYVAAAAVALKALDGRADVLGVSRRRLPEFLSERAAERGTPQWKRIYLLGVSLSGDPETLQAALAKLKAKGVSVAWISAIEMPE